MLSHIRKPYLNMDTRPHASRQTTRILDLGSSEESWFNIRYLTNEERDQIDLQARLILIKCADRVKEMETLETRTKCSSHIDQRNLRNRRLQVFRFVLRQSGACYQSSEPAREVPSCEVVARFGSDGRIGIRCCSSCGHHLVLESTTNGGKSNAKGDAGRTCKASDGKDTYAWVRSDEGESSDGSPILYPHFCFWSGTNSEQCTRELARKCVIQSGLKLSRNYRRQL